MNEQIGKKVKNGFFWTFSERFGSRGIQFLLQLFLARILLPDDYGLCALLLAFVNISTVFINSGLNTALIQKKDADSIDFSSVFYLSFFISIIIYVTLFFASPFIASFFNDIRITDLLRVISVSLIIGSYNSIQIALLTKRMQFEKLFKANIIGILSSALVAIYLAISGYGVWAIVAQYLVLKMVTTVLLSILVCWHPSLEFSLSRLKILFSFGWKCMTTSLLSTLVTNIYTTVVGKFYTKAELGTYDTGNRIPSVLSETFTSSLGSVLFPVFSTLQDDTKALKFYVQKTNKITTFLMFPLMFGLVAVADPLIRIVLTEKWISAVPFLQMFCVLYAFYPLHIANIQAINAIGRSDVSLKNETLKKGVDLLFLIIMINFSLYFVVLGRVLTSVIALWINMKPNKKFLCYSFREQIKDVFRSFIISVLTCVFMFIIPEMKIFSNVIISFTLQVVLGFVFYTVISYLFNKSNLKLIFSSILKK